MPDKPVLVPVDALELPAGAQKAEILTRYQAILEPKVGDVIYQIVIADCTCADLELFYGCPAGRHVNRFYARCARHGVQALGPAVRAETGLDPRRLENRRRSSYTTEKWYSDRGM